MRGTAASLVGVVGSLEGATQWQRHALPRCDGRAWVTGACSVTLSDMLLPQLLPHAARCTGRGPGRCVKAEGWLTAILCIPRPCVSLAMALLVMVVCSTTASRATGAQAIPLITGQTAQGSQPLSQVAQASPHAAAHCRCRSIPRGDWGAIGHESRLTNHRAAHGVLL